MKKKRFLAFLLSFALMVPTVSVGAAETEATTANTTMETTSISPAMETAEGIDSGSCGDNLTWTFDATTGALTISGTGAMTNYDHNSYVNAPWYPYRNEIRSVVLEDGITTVGSASFYQDYLNLTSVTLPNSVTRIEDRAFEYGNLTSIDLPNQLEYIGLAAFCGNDFTKMIVPETVKEIGKYAFRGCQKMESIQLPSDLKLIDEYLFESCYALKNITIPEPVTKIGYRAFDNCTSLESVTIPKNVTVIAEECFNDCTSLKKVLFAEGSSLTAIESNGNGAFQGCTALTSIALPTSVTYIGSYSFSGCTALTSVTGLENVTHLGKGSFRNCTSLKEISIPAGISVINDETFYNCDSLKEVTIPGNITTIDYNAFYGCYNLETVDICEGVTTIDQYAFRECNNMKTMYLPKSLTSLSDYSLPSIYTHSWSIFYAGTSEKWNTYNLSLNNYCKVYFNTSNGSGTFGTDNALTWKLNDDTLTISGNGAMTDYDTMTNPPWSAYYGRIRAIVIEEGITAIGSRSFSDSAATSVSLPSTLKEIHWAAFGQCPLTEISLPEGLTKLGPRVFVGCPLTEITLPASLTYFAEDAFSGCSNLQAIHVSADNQNFTSADGILYSKDKKTLLCCPEGKPGPIVVPSGTTAIGNSAFYGSTASSITLPEGLMSIGNDAFYCCYDLSEIDLPESLTSIGSDAFYFCESLSAINLPDALTAIPASAFNSCSALKTVTGGRNVTTIGSYAFYGCDSLKKIRLYNKLTSLGSNPFSNTLDTICFYGSESDWESIENVIYLPSSITIKYMEAGTCGENATWGFDYETGILTISGTGKMTDYSSGTNLPWNSLRSSITSIVVEDGITSIGAYAFYGCTKATEIHIPDSVTSLGNYWKYNCSALKTIHFDGSRFQWIVVNDGSISNDTVVYGTTINTGTCGENAIWTLDETTGILTISGTGTMSNSERFNYSTIGELATSLVIKEGITAINADAFRGAVFENIKTVSLPETLTTIGANAFSYSGITAIDLPKGITQLDAACFNNMSITSITLPVGINRVPDFNYCSATDIYFEGSSYQWNALPKNETTLEGRTIHFLQTTAGGTCGDHLTWSYDETTKTLTISGTGDMTDYTSSNLPDWNYYQSEIQSVVIEDGVTSIGSIAFHYCENLTNVSVGNTVKTIGSDAFSYCSSLTSIDLPASLTEMDLWTFIGCSFLQAINVAEGCSTYASVDGVLYSGDGTTLLRCPEGRNTAVTVPSGTTTIGITGEGNAFFQCSKLPEVTLPATITTVNDPFYSCRTLTEIHYEGSITEWNNTVTTDPDFPEKLLTFAVESTILTRASFCEYLAEVLDVSTLDATGLSCPYTDLSTDSSAYNSILLCYHMGWLDTVNWRTTFAADTELTRQEMAAILNAAGQGDELTTTAPTDITSSRYYNAICNVLGSGVMTVDAAGNFNPSATAYSTDVCTENLSPTAFASETSVLDLSDGSIQIHSYPLYCTYTQNGITVNSTYGCMINQSESSTANTITVTAENTSAKEIRLTLAGISITSEGSPLIVEDKVPVSLFLTKNNALTSTATTGISAYGCDLTINGTGTLKVQGNGYGIYAVDGSVTIKKGTITATGTNSCEGIAADTIEISGGSVTVSNDKYAPAMEAETIILSDCTVSATANSDAAISSGNGGSITITNATVTAVGGEFSSAIGGNDNGKGGTVTILNSTVTATGGYHAIGGGSLENEDGCDAITITNSETDLRFTDEDGSACHEKITIRQQPVSAAAKVGNSALISLTAQSHSGLSYQWELAADDTASTWAAIDGQTATILTDPITRENDGKYYRCQLTNKWGNTIYSDQVQAFVLAFRQQPKKEETGADDMTALSVVPSCEFVTYQWQKSTDNGTTWTTIESAAAKSDILIITLNAEARTALYRCIITASNGDWIASDASTIEGVPETEESYSIESILITDSSGNACDSLPTDSFQAEIQITNLQSETADTVILAAYDANGQLISLHYMDITAEIGASTSVTATIDNSNDNITSLKAFIVPLENGQMPLAIPAAFPEA